MSLRSGNLIKSVDANCLTSLVPPDRSPQPILSDIIDLTFISLFFNSIFWARIDDWLPNERGLITRWYVETLALPIFALGLVELPFTSSKLLPPWFDFAWLGASFLA